MRGGLQQGVDFPMPGRRQPSNGDAGTKPAPKHEVQSLGMPELVRGRGGSLVVRLVQPIAAPRRSCSAIYWADP